MPNPYNPYNPNEDEDGLRIADIDLNAPFGVGGAIATKPNDDPLSRQIRDYQSMRMPERPRPSGVRRGIAAVLGGLAGAANVNPHIRPIPQESIQQTRDSILYPGYNQQLADYEHQRQAAAENINTGIRQEQVDTNKLYRQNQLEQMRANAAARQQAIQDREIQIATNPALEEIPQPSPTPPRPIDQQPGTEGQPPVPAEPPKYRGTVNIGKKTYGVLPPEVLEERKRKAAKAAEEANYRTLPKTITEALQMEAGTKVPPNELDSFVRAYEAHAARLAKSPEQMLQERTNIADAVKLMGRDRQVYLATGNIERPERAQAESGSYMPMFDASGKMVGAWNPKSGEFKQNPQQNLSRTPPRGLTSEEKRRVDSADATIKQVDVAISQIAAFEKKHRTGLVGDISQRALGTVGLQPEELGAVDTALESAAALQPGQHNFRSQAALSSFKRALGIDPMTGKMTSSREWLKNPAKAKSALKELSKFNQTLKDSIQRNSGGGTAATPPQTAEPQIKILSVEDADAR